MIRFIFNTHGGDSRLNERSGEPVIVVGQLAEKEADIADIGKVFRVRFDDNFETDAFADELTLDEYTTD